jgi:hypothetical protein
MMHRVGRLMCWIGLHDVEVVHDTPAEEAARRLAEATSLMEMMQIMWAGMTAWRWVCTRCGKEARA